MIGVWSSYSDTFEAPCEWDISEIDYITQHFMYGIAV